MMFGKYQDAEVALIGINKRRKGVDGFSVETAVSSKHPFSPSSDSLTDACGLTVHNLCHNQAFCGLHSSFAYRKFNSNFTCDDPTILPCELIYSRNRGTVGHNVRLPRAWEVLDVYASRLITLAPPEYSARCETLLSVHLFYPAINLLSMLPFWITALCADLEESIMQRTAETTLQK
ncbi:hypothetical protein AVEN_213798-1 [Araneus ventricosus]|uniref:Uncharacterized protein n=2 Tax=Araneus ventricosus TaxID=182803 RepID=A0A4Y2T107_ARAVE|nr:hypothetical protein AVEN_213798-1 [Araneus ventricosus]